MLRLYPAPFPAPRSPAPPWSVGEAAVLVQRDGEDVGTLVEDRLRTVAVMHVPVDHCHARQLVLGNGALDGNRDVGEKAEAQAAVGKAMMPGRPRQCIGIAQRARSNARNGLHRQPGRKPRDVVAARPEGGLEADLAALPRAEFREAREIGCRMHAAKILVACHRSRADIELRRKAGDIEQALEPALAVGRLRIVRAARRLHPAAHRKDQGMGLPRMPEAALIGEQEG